jgi:hypothetical protein
LARPLPQTPISIGGVQRHFLSLGFGAHSPALVPRPGPAPRAPARPIRSVGVMLGRVETALGCAGGAGVRECLRILNITGSRVSGSWCQRRGSKIGVEEWMLSGGGARGVRAGFQVRLCDWLSLALPVGDSGLGVTAPLIRCHRRLARRTQPRVFRSCASPPEGPARLDARMWRWIAVTLAVPPGS